MAAKETKQPLESRAVIRTIEPGCDAQCPYCLEPVKFKARQRNNQVICNVYVDGHWDRVEQFHEECYLEAESPHGEAKKTETPRPRRRKAKTND